MHAAAAIHQSHSRAYTDSFMHRSLYARYGRGARFSHEPDADGPHPMCQAALAAVSMTLLISGVWLWFASWTDTRAIKVAEFNGMVSNWTHRYRPSFDASNMSISINGSAFFPLTKDLSSDITGTAKLEMSAADIDKWEQLKYRMDYNIPQSFFTGVTLFDPFAPLPGGPAVPFVIRAGGSNGDVVYSQTLRLREWDVVPGNQKMCHVQGRGVWAGTQCWALRTLRATCVKVKQDNDGGVNLGTSPRGDKWVPAGTGGNQQLSGCLQISPVTYLRLNEMYHAWPKGSNGTLAKLPVLTNHGLNLSAAPKGTIPEGGSAYFVSIAIRHAQDPYLRAFQFTEKSFTFGQTPRQNFLESILLMTVGAVILSPLICLWCYKGEQEVEKRMIARRYQRTPATNDYDSDDDDGVVSHRSRSSSSTRRRGGSRDRDNDRQVEKRMIAR
eukprot:CAMPEP_0173432160 /NCGR_PEP_ID=MMETSP1357-20121228/10053_1 /TAXON_ID=77926 /ORGANISM="Hemiselmis rufescens, Strain PCC563" /LENGTH=440 /DNA_ID=CAMNT_0014396723 /DNA_START=89 /DNA_END=1408 /DNA_ORIENTATION=-